MHPTGFVDPANPAACTRFLAPERLRGCGALLLLPSGRRFVDELSTREHVVGAMMEHSAEAASTAAGGQPVFHLALPLAGCQQYGMEAIKFYSSRGFFVECSGVEEAAATMGCSEQELHGTLAAYNRAATGVEADAHRKSVFPCPADPKDLIYIARVTPVVHYTMGGVRIDSDGRVLRPDGSAVPGLFAAGEVTGGVHGRNRLAGNSLLECVVFGRRAGRAALASMDGLAKTGSSL